jgi:hypothetical protein
MAMQTTMFFLCDFSRSVAAKMVDVDRLRFYIVYQGSLKPFMEGGEKVWPSLVGNHFANSAFCKSG